MTRTTARLVRLAGGLLATGIVLAGCSESGHGSGTHTGTAAGSAAGDSAEHDDADVTFVHGMIPHHEGALEMARLADSRAQDDRVLELASRIEAAQEPEIETMTGWLEAWGEPLPENMPEHGTDHGSGGMGMMSGEDMAALEAAQGTAFDRMFLEMMVEHHRGAVEMAETEIEDGSNTDAIALAREIRASQAAEIEEMESLLESSGG